MKPSTGLQAHCLTFRIAEENRVRYDGFIIFKGGKYFSPRALTRDYA